MTRQQLESEKSKLKNFCGGKFQVEIWRNRWCLKNLKFCTYMVHSKHNIWICNYPIALTCLAHKWNFDFFSCATTLLIISFHLGKIWFCDFATGMAVNKTINYVVNRASYAHYVYKFLGFLNIIYPLKIEFDRFPRNKFSLFGFSLLNCWCVMKNDCHWSTVTLINSH